MGIEIEHKYTIDTTQLFVIKNLEIKKENIEQFYISRQPTIRVRRSEVYGDNGKISCEHVLCVKGDGRIKRQEDEFYIDYKTYEIMKKSASYGVKKTRHHIKVADGNIWHVDEFHARYAGTNKFDFDSDKWYAEIELQDEKQNYEIPRWCIKNVSLGKEYSSASISECGWPK